jgi:hypothetical protein
MDAPGTTLRGTVELDVPAHVAYERMCRMEEYPLFRHRVRQVTAVSDTLHRWELAETAFTAHLDERCAEGMLRWHSVEGPQCAERVEVRPITPRRSQLTVESSGPPDLVAQLAADLAEFKRHVERDHPPVGHFVNERPAASFRHRSNCRDDRMHGATSDGTGR